MKKLAFHLAGLLIAGAVLAAPSRAASVYGTTVAGADLSSSRSTATGGGLNSGGAWDKELATITWTITDNDDGTWNYVYRLEMPEAPGISHVILDLTDDAVLPGKPADPNAVTNLQPGTLIPVYDSYDDQSQGNSNPGLIAPIVGVKFNNSGGAYPSTISFTSNRAPVWGDVYVKGGSTSYVRNLGLTDHGSENKGLFIARPNGAGVVPEPSSLALAGIAGLTGLGLAARRRMK